MSEQKRVAGGVPGAPKRGGGQFLGAVHGPPNGVSLLPNPQASSAPRAALNAAAELKRTTDEQFTNATLAVVAETVLQVRPTAVYLTLERDHEEGCVVRPGSLLDKDFRVIDSHLDDCSRPADAEVTELLTKFAALGPLDGHPAISDPFAGDDAWSATGERRLHLRTATAQFAPKPASDDAASGDAALVADALIRAEAASTYSGATTILTEALTPCLAGRFADEKLTSWTLDATYSPRAGRWTYDTEITVTYSDADDPAGTVEETVDLGGSPGADLIDELARNGSLRGELPTITWSAVTS